jgi:hypothetical protein
MARGGTSAARQKGDVLELHDPDPARPLAVTGAQPDIVGVREPDFEAAMRS